METWLKKNKIIILLIFVALASGIFWSQKMFGQPVPEGGDEGHYHQMAVNILKFKGRDIYRDEIARTPVDPLYLWFLAGVYRIFGPNYDAVRIIQLFIFAATVAIVYFLSREILGSRLAPWPTLLTALFFPLAGFAGRLGKEIIFTFCLVLFIFCLYKLQASRKLIWYLLAAITFFLAALTNNILFPLAGSIFLVLLIRLLFNQSGKRLNRTFLTVSLGIFLLIVLAASFLISQNNYLKDSIGSKVGAFLYRKLEVSEQIRGHFSEHLVGQVFGYYFAQGLNPAIEYKLLLGGYPRTEETIIDMRKEGFGYLEIRESLMRLGTLNFFRNLPTYLKISFLEFLQFNGPMLPNPHDLGAAPMQNLFIDGSHPEIPEFLKIIILTILRIIYWLFFAGVIYGLVRTIKNWRKFGWLLLIIIYFNLAYAFVFGLPRYAIPIYPFYFILFVLGVVSLMRKKRLSALKA